MRAAASAAFSFCAATCARGSAIWAPIAKRSRCTPSRSCDSSSSAWVRATPMTAFSSSTSPKAATRGWSLRTREPSTSPVSPPSPVFV